MLQSVNRAVGLGFTATNLKTTCEVAAENIKKVSIEIIVYFIFILFKPVIKSSTQSIFPVMRVIIGWRKLVAVFKKIGSGI